MFQHAIVRPPASNFADGLTTVDFGKPDYALALRQHKAYGDALRKCGLTLTCLDMDARYPFKLRGAGDVLGTQQSGLPPFRLVSPEAHADMRGGRR